MRSMHHGYHPCCAAWAPAAQSQGLEERHSRGLVGGLRDRWQGVRSFGKICKGGREVCSGHQCISMQVSWGEWMPCIRSNCFEF